MINWIVKPESTNAVEPCQTVIYCPTKFCLPKFCFPLVCIPKNMRQFCVPGGYCSC
jgi:hypothetical protein